jgi:hypothetical protein
MHTLESQKSQFGTSDIVNLLITEDGSRWFLYAMHSNDLYSFAVYDPVGDSLKFHWYMIPGRGDFAISRDQSEIYITNPGGFGSSGGSDGIIYVCDVAGDRISREISTFEFEVPEGSKRLYVMGYMYITPDGRHMVGQEPPHGSFFVHIPRFRWDQPRVYDVGQFNVAFYMTRSCIF